MRRGIKQYSIHGDNAFPGKGNLRPDDAAMKKLEKEIKDLKEENAISKKVYGHLQQRREIKYFFIREHSSEFPVKKMCQIFDVSRSAYYDWLNRLISYVKKRIYICLGILKNYLMIQIFDILPVCCDKALT